MPQLDVLILKGQFLIFLVSFIIIYILLTFIVLPTTFKNLKVTNFIKNLPNRFLTKVTGIVSPAFLLIDIFYENSVEEFSEIFISTFIEVYGDSFEISNDTFQEIEILTDLVFGDFYYPEFVLNCLAEEEGIYDGTNEVSYTYDDIDSLFVADDNEVPQIDNNII